MSINGWMDKEDVLQIYSGILLSHKKEWNNAICSNMDELRDYYSKWSKSDRERQIPYDITYMWNLKYDANELVYKPGRNSQTLKTNLGLPKGKDLGGINEEFAISRHKLYIADTIADTQRRWWHPISILLPGGSHGRRILVDCSPWGCKE